MTPHITLTTSPPPQTNCSADERFHLTISQCNDSPTVPISSPISPYTAHVYFGACMHCILSKPNYYFNESETLLLPNARVTRTDLGFLKF